MTDEPVDDVEAAPHPLRILPVLVIVPAVAWLAREWGGAIRVDWTTWTIFVVSSTALLGMPALFWALDHQHTRLSHLSALGAVIGAVPMLAVVASGVLGRIVRWGWAQTMDLVVSQGAPIPTYGYLSWPMFVRVEIYAAAIGAASAAIYWALFIRTGAKRRT